MSTATESIRNARHGGAARWVALAVLLLALTMGLFDITIVNLTLPSVTESLNAHPETLSWLVAGYILGYALALVPAGRLGDRYGHKWIFIIGTLGYIVTAVLVSLSPNENFLIVARVLHGIAGGFMIAPITAIIQLLFEGVSRVRAFGYWAATTGLGALFGPILGGLVLDAVGGADGWRWALVVGLPLGVLALILAVPLLPNVRGINSGRFDVLGMILLAIIVIGLIGPLIQGLPAWGTISAVVAVIALIVFIIWERTVEKRGGIPILRLSNFRRSVFSLGLLSTVVAFASFTSAIYIAVATVWQFGRGESALQSALVMLTFGLGAIIGGVLDDRFSVWFKRWDVTVALVLLVGGYVVTYFLLIAGAATVSLFVLSIPLLIAGIGSGAFIGLNLASVMSSVADRDAGSVSGLVITAQRVGSALGAAVVLLVTSLPPAEGASEGERWITNGIYGVLACIVFAAVALLLTLVAAIRERRDTALPEQADAQGVNA